VDIETTYVLLRNETKQKNERGGRKVKELFRMAQKVEQTEEDGLTDQPF
jgi:hypothetical protein